MALPSKYLAIQFLLCGGLAIAVMPFVVRFFLRLLYRRVANDYGYCNPQNRRTARLLTRPAPTTPRDDPVPGLGYFNCSEQIPMIVALFIIFTSGVIFLYPVAMVFHKLLPGAKLAVGTFLAILVVGAAQQWPKVARRATS